MNENVVTTEVWEDIPVDITSEANFIWSIANKFRGAYMPDKYGDVIIPMTIIRRFECVLEKTKDELVKSTKKIKTFLQRPCIASAESSFIIPQSST